MQVLFRHFNGFTKLVVFRIRFFSGEDSSNEFRTEQAVYAVLKWLAKTKSEGSATVSTLKGYMMLK
jgi:hypothetical protein